MKACHKILRVKKEDSAFLYFVLESQEGMTSYSTLPHQNGDSYRDIELCYSESYQNDVKLLIERLGGMVHELKQSTE